EAKLLADDGENRVGVRAWQVVEFLPARAETQAKYATRAECNRRLGDVPADAKRILRRIEKGDDPVGAVGRAEDDQNQRRGAGQYADDEMRHVSAGHEEEAHRRGRDHERAAEIRL